MKRLSIFVWGALFYFSSYNTGLTESAAVHQINRSLITCRDYLLAAGLENVQFQIARHQTIWLSYENRRYRNEITALGIVLTYATHCLPFAQHFVVVPHYRKMPLRYIEVDREVFQKFLQQEISADDLVEHLQISYESPAEKPLTGYRSSMAQSSLFHIDLMLSPGVKAQFARPDDPAQLQFNCLADLSVTIAPGLQLFGQWIGPLYNEFQRPETNSRVGALYLQQLVRLPARTFVTMSAGRFEFDRQGLSAQVKTFFWRERLSLAARGDYVSGQAINRLLPLELPSHNKLSYLFQVQYRFEPIHFMAQLTWGRYLLGDQGWRIDIVRLFHEIELGFMGVWNESLDFLTGMTVRLPLPMAKHPWPGAVRVRSPNYLSWNYRYLPCFDGLILDTGEDFETIARQFTRSFIRGNCQQFQTALRYVRLNTTDAHQKLLAERGK
ncbi:MAG: YjbH domain-containing protein [candidate division KSB1 bacterium]|nr:YjbH domain-containing protein [candidate division KSB1 bacterium]MDZ7317954.1 YjbH domain-containing protein [candidate division KSB1 bacterium]MDZ7342152.1 YjbH domain-containing protein [candidate division KSB1 bacterium]